MNKPITRRRVLLTGAIASAAVALGRSAHADSHKLALDDPQAMALGYVEDAATVDRAKFPRMQDGQNCETCALYQPGEDGWGGCGIFPGKLVAGPGWCNAFAPKP